MPRAARIRGIALSLLHVFGAQNVVWPSAFIKALTEAERKLLTNGGIRQMRTLIFRSMLFSIALAAATLFLPANAQAQNRRGHIDRHERRELRSDRREVRGDTRELRGDRRETRSDRHDLRADVRDYRRDRRDGASQAELRSDRREIRGDGRELRSDRHESRTDRRDRRADARDYRRDRRDARQD